MTLHRNRRQLQGIDNKLREKQQMKCAAEQGPGPTACSYTVTLPAVALYGVS